jgi:hypothetical protein
VIIILMIYVWVHDVGIIVKNVFPVDKPYRLSNSSTDAITISLYRFL